MFEQISLKEGGSAGIGALDIAKAIIKKYE
jgi:hypothetical protein